MHTTTESKKIIYCCCYSSQVVTHPSIPEATCPLSGAVAGLIVGMSFVGIVLRISMSISPEREVH